MDSCSSSVRVDFRFCQPVCYLCTVAGLQLVPVGLDQYTNHSGYFILFLFLPVGVVLKLLGKDPMARKLTRL